MRKPEKLMKPYNMGTHLRVLSERYSMNINMNGFQKSLHPCALDESSLSIGSVTMTSKSTQAYACFVQ